jgi:hypothetical protein
MVSIIVLTVGLYGITEALKLLVEIRIAAVVFKRPV